jgi:hypothetical protein
MVLAMLTLHVRVTQDLLKLIVLLVLAQKVLHGSLFLPLQTVLIVVPQNVQALGNVIALLVYVRAKLVLRGVPAIAWAVTVIAVGMVVASL